MFQEKDLANHIHRSTAMPPSVPIGKECACVFICSRVSSLENGVQKNQPERHASQIYKNRKVEQNKQARPSKDLPKRPVSSEICVLQYNESNDRDDESQKLE